MHRTAVVELPDEGLDRASVICRGFSKEAPSFNCTSEGASGWRLTSTEVCRPEWLICAQEMVAVFLPASVILLNDGALSSSKMILPPIPGAAVDRDIAEIIKSSRGRFRPALVQTDMVFLRKPGRPGKSRSVMRLWPGDFGGWRRRS
ncbi:MAG: hypothetical protein IPJ40_12055 [Saprospirales bacterium]|nr:hypothetical protein [Saprospirales bacterium]